MNNLKCIVTSVDVERHILQTCSPFKKCCFLDALKPMDEDTYLILYCIVYI